MMNKLPEGWEWKKLGEVCEKTDNFSWNNYRGEKQYIDLTSVSRELLEVTDCQIINSKNAPSRAKKNVSTNDVIFATTRPTLKRVTIIKSEYNDSICSTGFVVLRGKSDKIMPEWIYHIILTEPFMKYVKVMQKGASYPAITDNEVKNYVIPLPPLVEQKRIVVILDEAFAAIDKAKANAEKNLANAKELFESYLNGIFANPGEDWEEKRLGEVCELINGRAYKKNELLNNGKYKVLRVGNFFTNQKWYYSDLELDSDKYCENGDLLYAWSASFGPRIWENEKTIYHYHIWKVKYNPEKIKKIFLYYWLSWDAEKIKKEMGAGTTMTHVSMKSMNNRILTFPVLVEQKRIVNQLDKLSDEAKHLESIYQQKITDLEELKKSILKKAFEGEL